MSAVLDRMPELSAFRAIVPAHAWAAALEVLDSAPQADAPRAVQAGTLHAEYRAHLLAGGDHGKHHAGLAQAVAALSIMDQAEFVHVRHISGAEGRIILLTNAADQPLGLVTLRPVAA